jgi:two-component system nitrogen regulation response regulator NtrX
MREAAESSRHVLLSGPSGSGKELTARGLAALMGLPGPPLPFLAHNAARFSSEEEATSTLFGVAARVFSNVSARPGLIEEAGVGVLFLDEVHNLPDRVQRSLLRVIEDGQTARIGETGLRPTNARFVLASNMPPPDHGLAHDLLARLRVAPVAPLKERIADIPSIFDQLLTQAAKSKSFAPDQVLPLLSADHYEAMCLDRFEAANVRGLTDLVDRLVSRVATGVTPARAVATLFAERFPSNPVIRRRGSTPGVLPPDAPPNIDSAAGEAVSEAPPGDGNSHYERHRDAIISAYRECGGNLSAAKRLLLSRGIRCSRRWLRFFVKKWGLRS